MPANLVLTTSANAVVAKKGSLAYDTSKAAANHLVRELAVELAPLVRVNGVAPATVVQGSSMFPRDRVIASLTKYNIPFSEVESDDSAARQAGPLLRRPHADQVADHAGRPGGGVFPAVQPAAGKTTGQVITVDGGLTRRFCGEMPKDTGGPFRDRCHAIW